MAETTDPTFNRRLRKFRLREFRHIRGSQQLMLDMTGLEELLGIADASDFARRHGIPRSRIAQLEDDSWSELSKPHLLKLLALESDVRHDHPDFQLLRVVPDLLWATFDSPAIGFVGTKMGDRVKADWTLLSAFEAAGVSLQPPGDIDVATAMRESNCIVLGSTKWNRWTEDAIEALWPDGVPPVRFSWPASAWPDDRQESRVSKKGEKAIEFLNEKEEVQSAVELSPDCPVGVLIVCRSPLGTKKPVTTIIAAGPTKYGTLQVVEDILSGSVYVWSEQLVPGKASVFVLGSKGKRWHNLYGERQLAIKQAARRQAVRRDLR
ncbi:MAG: hypothetical protein AAB403_00090 [Planctomycetota bacterium]